MGSRLTVTDFMDSKDPLTGQPMTREKAEREVKMLVFGQDFREKNGQPVEQGIGSESNPFKTTHMAELDRQARSKPMFTGHRFPDDEPAPRKRHARSNKRRATSAKPKAAPASAEA